MTVQTAVLLIVTNLGTAAASTVYYITRHDEQRRECQDRIAQANAETLAIRGRVRNVEVRERLLDAVPVSRLIESEDGTK